MCFILPRITRNPREHVHQKLSLEYCKQVLEANSSDGRVYTLDEVERIRDALYAIAELTLSSGILDEMYRDSLASDSRTESD